MYRELALAVLIACMSLFGMSQVRADIIYTLDSSFLSFGTETVITGTITTNGNTTTPLSASDIVAWHIHEGGDFGIPGCSICIFDLSPFNSSVTVVGNALTATPTSLRFDFSSLAASSFMFTEPNFMANGGLAVFEACDGFLPSPCIDNFGERSSAIGPVITVPQPSGVVFVRVWYW